jgi:cytochrome P450 PksS
MKPVNIFSPEFKRSPYASYAEMRQHAPVCRVLRPDGTPIWLITRYEDVMAVIKDPRFKKNFRSVLTPEELQHSPLFPEDAINLTHHMLSSDPPDHTRLRNLVSKAFSPRLVQELRPRIVALANQLIDTVLPRGHMDLIDDYAFELPITIIAELLGVPHQDRDRFRQWSNVMVGERTSPEAFSEIAAAGRAFAAYLTELFAVRRKEPRADLISALVQAEESGDQLSEIELLSTVFLLLVAGHETTVNLIGNGILALLTHPSELERLRREPSLLPQAVEEFLRFEGPVETSTARFPSEDVELNGVTIPRGNLVLVVLASANRDPEQFPEPERLDIGREDNRHVAFGHGLHYCLGAALARLEGQIAIGTLLERLPNLRLAVPVEQLTWRPGLLIRGLTNCPLTF